MRQKPEQCQAGTRMPVHNLIPGEPMRTLLICFLVSAGLSMAQENPLSTFNKGAYGRVKMILLRSAEKMPEENYSFKPTDSVRSFGQIVGHVADAQYMFCSIELGEKNPAPKI